MSKRSWIKIIPYGLLALFTVLVVYDPTLDASQLENTPVTQIADISTQELSNNKIKELHVVKNGENLSVIFLYWNFKYLPVLTLRLLKLKKLLNK